MARTVTMQSPLIQLSMTPDEAQQVITSTGHFGHFALAEYLDEQLKEKLRRR